MEQSLAEHLEHISQLWHRGLEHAGFDAVWLAAGSESMHFQDDHGPAFKANPYFTQWVDPAFAHAGAHLFLSPGEKPQLFLLKPTDYWHATTPIPEYLQSVVDINIFSSSQSLLQACGAKSRVQNRYAYIGQDQGNENLGIPNDPHLLDFMAFHRGVKTNYELENMRNASEIGVHGHIAAAEAFRRHGSEFDIHMAYLSASGQTENQLPYANIVELNEHGATLHYQRQDRDAAKEPRSLLIDAGGNYRGYASDITRTYCASGPHHEEFRSLLGLMQDHQDTIIEEVRSGISYAYLHRFMHEQLAQVLFDASLIHCSAQEAFALGVTEKFCPHGLGHLLGIQVHDVGGHLADEQGRTEPPPDNYPSLRTTRTIEPDQVFTIEPGLYFIDSLLEALAEQHAPINWDIVNRLRDYGGIRIEDNVRVLEHGVENLTRDAWTRIATSGRDAR